MFRSIYDHPQVKYSCVCWRIYIYLNLYWNPHTRRYTPVSMLKWLHMLCTQGPRGSVVVEALCCKSEGRGFESRFGHLFFFLVYLILPAAQWPRGSLSLLQKWVPEDLYGGKARPARKADNLHPSVSCLSKKYEILHISRPYRPLQPVTGKVLLHLLFITFFMKGNYTLWPRKWRQNVSPKRLQHRAYPCYVSSRAELTLYSGTLGPPLWSSGQNSWLQIQRSGFDSRRYEIFWEVVGLQRGQITFVSITEELTEWYV
jgi:hypothetical protein